MSAAGTLVDRDRLLQKARDLRARHRLGEALATLTQLEVLYPAFSRLFQERGHCHVLQRNAQAAIAALREAVRLNPTLPASWDMLEQLYRMQGDAVEAGTAARTLEMLKQLPPEVLMANSLLADGDLDPAEQILRDYLHQDSGNAGAQRLLARIRAEKGDYAGAETVLAAILQREPDYKEARLDYAMVLLQQQKHLAARHEADSLLASAPDNRDYLKQYAAACIGLGDYEPLIGIYERLLAGQGDTGAEVADLRLWRAAALKITGNLPEAISDYRASVAARPHQGAAWFGLANLKTFRFRDEDIASMQSVEKIPGLQDMDRIYLQFALGKALEDRKAYEASWRYYACGNAARRATSRYRPGVARACADRLMACLTAEFFKERSGWGHADPAPIFILGLPRSGSTLVEQILASHSNVEGTQELTVVGRYAAELCGQDPNCGLPMAPEALLKLTPQAARALGERFIAETRAYRRLGRPQLIDKMPNNFWHVGLIQLILPQATIIDARRDPMSCGFSNFKQLFGTINQEFSYDLEHIASHYRAYLDLMRHWNLVLPGKVLRVSYEDLIDNLETGVANLLAHCGLPFEPACLAFHETRRSVRTPSSEQVRRPINREGVDQWHNYAPWLGGLRSALGDAVTAYKD